VGDLVRGRDGTEGAALAAVSAAIFQPTLAAVPPDIHRLIVIPDGGLNRLPLAALPVDDAGTTLSRRFTLTITPSASLYLALQGDRVPPGGAVLALGNTAEDRRRAVMLYLLGHTVPQAGELLGFGAKKAENLVYRGLADIRSCLEGKGVTP
jgi:CHAT domain-containing protein